MNSHIGAIRPRNLRTPTTRRPRRRISCRPAITCEFIRRPGLPHHLDVVLAPVDGPPRLGALRDDLVERVEVLDAAILQPRLQRRTSFLRVDRHAVLPCRAATE